MLAERWARRGAHGVRIAACGAMILTLVASGCGTADQVGLLSGRVVRVLDGDTIVVAGVGTVRYLGVDTPELHHPRKPVERFAARAAVFNRRLVAGVDVRLETDREVHDAYGRTLAYVYVGRVMVNAALVRAGMAESFAFAPNTTHKDLFEDHEADARTAGRGQSGPLEGGPPYGVP